MLASTKDLVGPVGKLGLWRVVQTIERAFWVEDPGLDWADADIHAIHLRCQFDVRCKVGCLFGIVLQYADCSVLTPDAGQDWVGLDGNVELNDMAH